MRMDQSENVERGNFYFDKCLGRGITHIVKNIPGVRWESFCNWRAKWPDENLFLFMKEETERLSNGRRHHSAFLTADRKFIEESGWYPESGVLVVTLWDFHNEKTRAKQLVILKELLEAYLAGSIERFVAKCAYTSFMEEKHIKLSF